MLRHTIAAHTKKDQRHVLRVASRLLVIFILFFIFMSDSFPASASFISDKSTSSLEVNISNRIAILGDPARVLTWEAIRSGAHDQEFKENAGNSFIGEDIETRYWFRLTFNRSDYDLALNDTLGLYFLAHPVMLWDLQILTNPENPSSTITETGFSRPYTSRDVDMLHYAFHIKIAENNVVYGYFDNQPQGLPGSLYIYLVSEKKLNDLEQRTKLYVVAFYSAFFIIVLYNLFLFLILRNAMYGYYVYSFISSIIYCASVDGSLASILLSNDPILNMRLGILASITASLAITGFIYYAFGRTPFAKWFQYFFYLYTVVGYMLIPVVLSTSDYRIAYTIQVYYPMAVGVFNIPVMLIAIAKRIYISKYVFLAESATITGGVLWGYMHTGKISIIDYFWCAHIGSILEAILLSFALAAQTRRSQVESIANLSKYQHLYDSSSQGLFQYTIADHTVKCNPAYANIFGFQDEAELLESEDPILQQEIDKITIALHERTLMNGGRLDNHEVEINLPTRRGIWLSLSTRLFHDEKDRPWIIDGSVIDVSERKKREAAEKDLMVSLERNSAIGDFTDGMSHELRTPLNSIINHTELLTELLTDHLKDNKDAFVLTNFISSSAHDLKIMVDDLLDQSKLENGNFELDPKPFSLREMLAKLQATYRKELTKEDKTVVFKMPTPANYCWTLIGDENRTSQVIINLIDNALKFTPKGTVSFGITLQELDDQYVNISFSVEDTGIGISFPDQARIFDHLKQVATNLEQRKKGLGLGLNISKSIINSMGSDIEVESSPGEGSRFSFTLKLPKAKAFEQAELRQKRGTAPGIDLQAYSGKSILIAEDDEANAHFIHKVLSRGDFKLTFAADGAIAVQEFKKSDFDLILMDIRMPNMKGTEAIPIIRAIERDRLVQKRIPIICMSANAKIQDEVSALNAGANFYITKPIDPREFWKLFALGMNYTKQDDVKFRHSITTSFSSKGLSFDFSVIFDRLQNHKMAFELLSSYIEQNDATLSELENHLVSDRLNFDATLRFFNRIRVRADKIGAYELGRTAEALENASKHNDDHRIQSVLEKNNFREMLQRTVDDVARFLDLNRTQV